MKYLILTALLIPCSVFGSAHRWSETSPMRCEQALWQQGYLATLAGRESPSKAAEYATQFVNDFRKQYPTLHIRDCSPKHSTT